MRRSNSSGCPVSSACTGASKPSVCADLGTSCTWPSVIMMTPASRSGGVLASALLRSANRLVPDAVSPVGRDEVTQRTCRLPPRAASLASRSRRIAAVCSGRPAIDWLRLSSTTTMAMLERLSRSSCRSVGLERASSSAASDRARSRAPRLRRKSSRTTRTAASTAPAQNRGAGTIGEKSIDQLLIALPPPLPALRGERVGVRGSTIARSSGCPSPYPSPRAEEAWGEGTAVIARASRAGPARAPGRPCSCRSART